MKKTLLSMTAALAVIGTANAGIKETCLEHPDKLAWVEKTQRCLPINTCKSDDQNIVDTYCEKVFQYVQVGSYEQADKLARKYIEKRMKSSVIDGGVLKTTFVGQDYYSYKLSDGGYVVFEFDDTSDKTGSDVRASIFDAVCEGVYNYIEDLSSRYEEEKVDGKFTFKCDAHRRGFAESDCLELANTIADVSGFAVDYKFYLEQDLGGCYITFR